jgi:hypothetical protein
MSPSLISGGDDEPVVSRPELVTIEISTVNMIDQVMSPTVTRAVWEGFTTWFQRGKTRTYRLVGEGKDEGIILVLARQHIVHIAKRIGS